VIPPARTLVIVNQNHLDIARPQMAALPSANLLVQPCNRDTGPGLVMALLTLARRDPEATLAVFPSDHFIRSHAAFAASVDRMQRVLAADPEKTVLLGIRPERPDPGLGYIVPATPRPPCNTWAVSASRGSKRSRMPRAPRRSSATARCGAPSSCCFASAACRAGARRAAARAGGDAAPDR
jgi:hypothetical protein